MVRFLLFLLIFITCYGCVDGQIADPNYDPSSFSRITGIAPRNGPLAGGTAITISGRNFTGTPTNITIGANNCLNIVFVDSSTLTCETPAGMAGVTSVVVIDPEHGRVGVGPGFNYRPVPTVTSITPDGGAVAGGTQVEINGTGFFAGVSVQIGGVDCQNTSFISSISISCSTPVGSLGSVDIDVTNIDAQSASLTGGFTYRSSPTVISITPNEGQTAGGTAVTIAGTGFLNGATIDIGGVACANVVFISAIELTCTTNMRPAGVADVTVLNPDAQTENLPTAFTYRAAPTVSSISPTGGALAGTTPLTITGTGFYAGASVDLGGSACASVTITSPTQITCTTTAHVAGAVGVQITNPDAQTGTLTGGYAYQAAPIVTNVNPTSGTVFGGTNLIITGNNFLDGAIVIINPGGGINQVACVSVVVVSVTEITCTTLLLLSTGAFVVQVENSDGQIGQTPTPLYSYVGPPLVFIISPERGPLAGGGTLTITGSDFAPGATVNVGGSVCMGPVVTTTRITCTIPAGSSLGDASVTVTNPDMQTSIFVFYTYRPPPTITPGGIAPNGGPPAGGTTITIIGTGFTMGATVDLGPTACGSVSVNSATEITCSAPMIVSTIPVYADITVTNADGQSDTLTQGYRFAPEPIVTAVAPTSGSILGGTDIAITGTDFFLGASVSLAGANCNSVTVISPTQITCTTTAAMASNVSITVTNSDGQDGTGALYTYERPPAITGISVPTAAAGALAGGTSVIIDGTDFITGATVDFGGSACTSVTVTSTQITCTTTAHPVGVVDVVVTNPNMLTGTLTGGYTYQATPTVTSISPIGGLPAGNTNVTVTGTGFVTGASVNIGTIACVPVIVSSATKITCTTAATIAGTYDVIVTNSDSQTATLPNAYSFQIAPTITTIAPNGGPPAGGTSVTITGTGFITTGTTTVDLGPTACGSVMVGSATQITCVVPAGTTGAVDVQITNPDTQTVTTTSGYTYRAAPTISSVSPIGGLPAGGTAITIIGTGFLTTGTTAVDLGGSACGSVVVNSATEITCTTSMRAAGSVNIQVTNPDMQTGTLNGGYAYQDAPVITLVSPNGGPIAGGTSITITGTGFLRGASVDFGGSACTSVAVNSSAQITCTISTHVAGSVDVGVTNSDGQTGTSIGGFTYRDAPTVTSVAPIGGSVAGGGTLTITGTGFLTTGTTTVDLGGNACSSVVIVSVTEITCTIPGGTAGSVAITVTNSDMQTGALRSAYTYRAAPTVASVFPLAGALAGGTNITLAGTGFVSGATVDFGGSACSSVTVNSSTQITCSTTAHIAGMVDVEVTNPDTQTGTLPMVYTYQAGPTVTSVSPLSGAFAGGVTLTISGTDFITIGTTTVDLGGSACGSVSVNSNIEITCIIPGGTGPATLTVINPDGQTGILAPAYTYQGAPTITTVTPNGGPPTGGNTITITGTGFITSGTTSVDLGGNTCGSVTVNSDTEITCTTAALTAGTANLQITNPDGQTGTLASAYTYQNDPTVTSILPVAGALAGGTSVIITGTDFLTSGTTSVDLGGNTCGNVVVNSDTEITCTTSANSAGVVNVSITNPDTQTGRLTGGYTYQAAPTVSTVSPSTGPLAGGTSLTITGTGFITGASVDLGGVACSSVTVNTATEIVCITTARVAGSVGVIVTNNDNQSGSDATVIFTYLGAPVISSVSPEAGALAGGNTLTITGTGYFTTGTIAVSVGGINCNSVNVVSSTQITCTTGARISGVVDIIVTNPDTQTGTLASSYTYQAAPVVSSITPTAGALAGGTSITITGTGFLTSGTTSVGLGGSVCGNVTVNSATEITCTTTTHAAGAVDIEVTNLDNQNSNLASAYTYQAAPVITSISPTSGPLAGGTPLTITGTGFLNMGTTSVDFEGSACSSVVVVSTTQITCSTTVHTAGAVNLEITNPDMQTGTLSSGHTYQAAPVVLSISPIGGPLGGATSVTITGTGFLSGASVDIGGACTQVTVNSPTQITCRTSANIAGAVDVEITNPDSQPGALASGYAYQAAPMISLISPSAGALAGGTSITIRGTGFITGASVNLGGVACGSVTVNTATEIVCTTAAPMAGAGAVNVQITNPDTQTDTSTSGYTYQAVPVITSVSPLAGNPAGGTSITITGTGFLSAGTTSIDLGGSACSSIVVNSATEITCTTTAHTAGVVDVEMTNPDTQTATSSSGYTYQARPVVSSISPLAGNPAGGTAITITGTGFLSAGTTSIDLGGSACSSIVVNSATEITCTTTAHTAGVVDLIVTNTDGQSETRINSFFYVDAPTVTSISPSVGSLSGGTSVTITGTGFFNGATVDVGVNCNSVVVFSLTQITCTTATNIAGAVDVIVTNIDGQSGTRTNSFFYVDAPTVTSISPLAGNPAGGTAITITGTGFLSGASVDLGVACTSVVVNSLTQITCRTGANAAGAVDVIVTNTDGQSGTRINSFFYVDAPTVTSISPSVGSLSGGTSVTITGTGFFSGATVDVGVNCNSVVVFSLTQITCTTATNTAGAVDVIVTNVDNQSGTLPGGFNYMPLAILQFATATPNPYNYGISNTSISYTFTLQNVGDIASSVITVFMGGTNSATWSIGTDNCSGMGNELAPMATCTVQATFLGPFFPTGNYSATVSAQASNGGTVQNQVSGEIP